NSESVGEFMNLFAVVERKWKLYRRRELTVSALAGLTFSGLPSSREHHQRSIMGGDVKQRKTSLREITEHQLLRNYAPACVAVNDQGDILYIHGRSGKYLELPAGDANLNLVRAAREGLKVELADGLRKVLAHRKRVSYQCLEVHTNGGFEAVDVTLELADRAGGSSDLILVTFRDSPPKAAEPPAAAGSKKRHRETSEPPDQKDRRIADLEHELHIKGETLQTTIEELETSNEELKSTNEELQSTNEELQSTNEELETSKEEL